MSQPTLQPVPEDWQRALVIVAHPDDIEYGVAGAVAKWTDAGKQVAYLLASRGEAGIDSIPPEQAGPLREAEERESGRIVGVESVEFLDYADGIIEYGLPLRRDLARAIRRHRPEVVIVSNFDLAWPSGMLNQSDHRAVGLAALDAARDAGNRWVFPELLREGHQPWSGSRYLLVSSPPAPSHACDIGDAIERCIAALKAHKAYFDNLSQPFDPESYLRSSAAAIGSLLGCQYAIPFTLYRL
jgi:LmbE family N-acetylglucosaminyl deacetylase